MNDESEQLQIRVQGRNDSLPTLIYLPGIHGDWTLVSSFRERMKPHVRFVEFTYPRTLSWSLADYGKAVLNRLNDQGIRSGILLAESFGSQVAWEVLGQGMERRHYCRQVEKNDRTNEHPPTQSPTRTQQPSGIHAPGEGNAAFPFQTTALILAGGFGRYPIMPLVDLTRVVWSIVPRWLVTSGFGAYGRFARWRHRHAPETRAAIREFLDRRTEPDLAAIGHRFKLIRENDPEAVVHQVTIPVHQLTGFWDPVVCHPLARRWLHKHCPGYRDTRVISMADHNVLGTAPDAAAEQVLEWIQPTPR